GTKAWKESEPSRIYFEILNKSINEMMAISDVLAERQKKKLPNLTKEEFDALMQFNKELRV
ncbi:MAG: hypothetical protein HQ536_01730, partial [Parcubacteria group bacterium]|nr:hypothetical protein [Parcubacteria group bacterium]